MNHTSLKLSINSIRTKSETKEVNQEPAAIASVLEQLAFHTNKQKSKHFGPSTAEY